MRRTNRSTAAPLMGFEMLKPGNPKKLAEDVEMWASNLWPRFKEFMQSARAADDGVNIMMNVAPLNQQYAEWVELDRRVRRFFKQRRIKPPTAEKVGRPRVEVDVNKLRERLAEMRKLPRRMGQRSMLRPGVVPDLAKEFGVSRATMYRLIEKLEAEPLAQQ